MKPLAPMCASSDSDSWNSACSETHRKGQIPTVSSSLPPVASTEICEIKNETADGGKAGREGSC